MNAKKRVALVTGGMGGLGEAICAKLAALGYIVVTTYSPGNTKAPEWLEDDEEAGLTFPRLSLRRHRLSTRAGAAWRRSPRTSVPSMCWSTTPASRAT